MDDDWWRTKLSRIFSKLKWRKTMNPKKRILTGDRPTSRLHLGHYVGSLENRIKLQDQYEQFIIIADLQALTTHFEHPEILGRSVFNLCLDYLAVGIDPEKNTIFIQSQVPQIAQLTVLYSMLVTVSTLKHNPTIKTEAAQYGFTDLSYGFLGYPVSQAADITFCQADLVPVGADQLPLVEVTRKIVRRFNSLYHPVLKEPESLLGSCPRLIGLDGRNKMSKSLGNAIYLSDDPETVTAKVKTAITDPARIHLADPGHPEICTIYEYHRVFNSSESANTASLCRAARIGCTACKAKLAEILNRLLCPIREQRNQFQQKPDFIRDLLQHGGAIARNAGTATLEKVRTAMQIRYSG